MNQRAAVFFLIFSHLVLLVVGKFTGWVDPDSTADVQTLQSYTDGNTYQLVMSDEFEREGRSFKNGDDPMWTGIDRSDDDQTSNGRKSLHFYNSSYIETRKGNLVIRTTDEDTKWRGWNPYLKKYETMSRHFRSGMLQSWNKFCFTGGILEVRVQFPGKSDVGGLWPAVWLLGNLGRATFEASTNLMWPWSYDACNPELQHAQEISACDVTNHFGLNEKQGRGATEIDIIEVMPGPSTPLPLVKNNVKRPYCSMTLQLAPGIPASKRRPQPGTLPEWGFHWYKNLTYGQNTSINPFFYGTYLAPTKTAEPVARSKAESYQCDAISSMVQLNDSHFQGMHVFRLEWQPGDDGYLKWFMDGDFKFGVHAHGLREQNKDSKIPNEPSYVILNTAISTSWGFPNPPPGCGSDYDCKDPAKQCGMNPGWCKTLPAEYLIDYVRIYQNKADPKQTLGCNPKEYPTKRFIKAHEYRYKALEEKHALKDVVTGGGACRSDLDCGSNSHNLNNLNNLNNDNSNSEGMNSGHNGVCKTSLWKFYENPGYKGCVCHENWQGPHCLVPTYQNDFEDWDREPMITWVNPFIPNFLAVWVLCILVALVVIIFFAWRWRQAKRVLHLENLMVHRYHNNNSHNNSATTGSSGSTSSSSWTYSQVPTTEMTHLNTNNNTTSSNSQKSSKQSRSKQRDSHNNSSQKSSSSSSNSHSASSGGHNHPEYAAASTHHINQTLYQAL